MLIEAVLLITVLFCLYFYYNKGKKDLVLPPKLSYSWPIIGIAPMLIGDTKHLFKVQQLISKECIEKGGVIHSYIGPHLSYVLTDPDDFHIVSNACLEKNFVYELMKPWLGDGLITVTNNIQLWKRHRKIANKAFNQQILEGFIGVFNSQARRLVEDFNQYIDKGYFDHSALIEKRDLETICKNALGVTEDEIDEYSNSKHVQAFQNLLNIIGHRFQTFWMYSDFLFSWTQLKKQQDSILNFLQNASRTIIQNRRLRKEKKNVETGAFKSYLDTLLDLPEEDAFSDKELQEEVDSMIVAGFDTSATIQSYALMLLGSNPDCQEKVFREYLGRPEGDAFTDKELQEEVDSMIVAGFDTSATMQSYALMLLGSNPDCQEKVFRELQEIFGSTDRDVDKQDLQRQVYLEAVLKETLRLYPITPVLPRYVAQDVQIKNYTLPAGSNCFMFVYGLHHNPQVWGSDVELFKPERWLDPASMPENPNAFCGFSLGKRGCLGKQYALMSMKTALAHVLRRYKVVADIFRLELQLDLLLKPASGCQIAIKKR